MASKGKILVVDDDSAARREIIEILESVGYDVVEGENGHQALSLVRDESPHLVVMDVEMPGMGGHEACRIIKGNKGFGFIPILLVTAHDDVQTKVDGLELGADDYLVKPLNRLEMVARVTSMMRLKNLQDELLAANQRLTEVNERLQELSMTDPLMKICNRLFFQKRINYEFQRADRYLTPLALLMADLDHFKQVNDSYGHPFGDVVLKKTAEVLESSVRQVDIVARYGGEELVIACPETNMKEAGIVAERIRSRIEKTDFAQGKTKCNITLSIGVAVCPDKRIHNVDELLNRADEALYAAKQAGRNCIRYAFEETELPD
jgi:two-component system, cell cycle response regulator